MPQYLSLQTYEIKKYNIFISHLLSLLSYQKIKDTFVAKMIEKIKEKEL